MTRTYPLRFAAAILGATDHLLQIPRRVADEFESILYPPSIMAARLVQELGRVAEVIQSCSGGVHRPTVTPRPIRREQETTC